MLLLSPGYTVHWNARLARGLARAIDLLVLRQCRA